LTVLAGYLYQLLDSGLNPKTMAILGIHTYENIIILLL